MPLFVAWICGVFAFSLCTLVSAAEPKDAASQEIPDAIDKFMARPEPAYRWEVRGTTATKAGRIHHLHLVSQTWHEITWEHALFVYEPPQIDHPEHMLLFVTGGSTGKLPNEKDQALGWNSPRRAGRRWRCCTRFPINRCSITARKMT